MSTEPFSLYFDLEENKKADLEVVASASLALVAAIKEVAYIIDPSIEISVELESGTAGSLSLNTLIKTIKEHVAPGNITALGIVFTVLSWFTTDFRQYEFRQLSP